MTDAPFNAADPRQVSERRKAQAAADLARQGVILNLMSSAEGRAYMHDRLVRSHVFHTSFARDPYDTAFAEGERNIGLQDLSDLMQYCPEQYAMMMREAQQKELTNGRRSPTGSDNGHLGHSADGNGGDSGPGSSGDYDPVGALRDDPPN